MLHAYPAATGWIDGPRIAAAAGDCHLCGRRIFAGHLITRAGDAWVHDACLTWPAQRWVAWTVALADCAAHHLRPRGCFTWCGLSVTTREDGGGVLVRSAYLWPGPEAIRAGLLECVNCLRAHRHAYTQQGIELLTTGGPPRECRPPASRRHP